MGLGHCGGFESIAIIWLCCVFGLLPCHLAATVEHYVVFLDGSPVAFDGHRHVAVQTGLSVIRGALFGTHRFWVGWVVRGLSAF